jgi:hypothetical protein
MGAKRAPMVINEHPVHLLWLGDKSRNNYRESVWRGLHERVRAEYTKHDALFTDMGGDLIKRGAREIEAQIARRQQSSTIDPRTGAMRAIASRTI